MKQKTINIKIIILALIFSPFLAKSQEIDKEKKDLIIKNIISYHFRYAQPFDLNLLNNGVFKDKSPFFERMWPSKNNELKIEIEKVDIVYPNSKYHFYHIIKRGFSFSSDTITKGYSIISLSFDKDYLVAIDSKNEVLNYISGNFFLSPISSDFMLDISKPESFFNFLKTRYFKMGAVNIKYHGRKHGKLIFYAYSTIAKEEVIMTVDESRFDNTEWEFKNKPKHIE